MFKFYSKIEDLLKPLQKEMKDLGPEIQFQLENYLAAVDNLDQAIYSEKEPSERNQELAMLYFKLWQFFSSREERVEDLKSDEVQEALKIKEEIFPYGIPKWVLCIDSRVLTKIIGCFHGGALKTPAGDLTEAVPDRNTGQFKLKEGRFADLLQRAFVNRDRLVQVFDSHGECAARGKEEVEKLALDKQPADHGLLADILHKKNLAQATKDWVENKYNGKKEVLVIQTSFSPEDGFLYMGLENSECLNNDYVKKNGYVHDILHHLVGENKIIHTKSLISEIDSPLKSLFAKNYFELNYETDYRDSSIKFWKNIKDMTEISGENSPLDFIENKLKLVFTHLSNPDRKDELKQRAVLVLANSYSGYLLNYDKDGNKKEYKYSKHAESVIAVAISEYGPFDRAIGFSVDPGDPDLSRSIHLARGIIQTVRKSGNFSETEKVALRELKIDAKMYPNYPIPEVHMYNMVELPHEQAVEQVKNINWTEVLRDVDWMQMRDDEFFEKVLDPLELSSGITRSINKIRKIAIKLYGRGQPVTSALLDGRSTPVWVLAGPKRETIAILPFVAKGY